MALDLFTRRGLGHVAGWVRWTLLAVGEAMTPTEISDTLHVPLRTVKTQLAKLGKHGLVRSSDGKHVAVPDVDLDGLAEHLGAAGYRDELRSRFAVEQADNRQERLDWYSAKVQAAAEDDRRLQANIDAIGKAIRADLTTLSNRQWKDPRTIPDPIPREHLSTA